MPAKGYYGFPSKQAYEDHYSDPANYAAEIPMMKEYNREAQAEQDATRTRPMHDDRNEWAAKQHEQWAANCRRAIQKTRPVEGAEMERRAKDHIKYAMFFRTLDYPVVTWNKENVDLQGENE